MDVWIAAVATGAVYISQHWKDLLKGKKNLGDSPHGSPRISKHNSLRNIHQALDKDCTSPRMLSRKGLDEDVSRARELGREDTMSEVASTSGLFVGNMGILDYSHSCNAPSCSNSLVGSKCDEKFQEGQEGARVGGDINEAVDDLSLHPSTIQMGFSHGLASRRYCLGSRKTTRHIMKPLIFLENSVAQFFPEQIEREYIFGSVPLYPTPRPFLVTDGSVIISRNSGDYFGMPVGTELDKLQKSVIPQGETISGVPKLPNVVPSEFPRKARASKKDQGRIFCNSSRKTNRKPRRSKGSSNEAFLLSLGASIGFFFSFLLYKKERDELNHKLKQKDNLVQDLQDELEMKDSFTVKELATEDYESEHTRIDASNNEAFYSLAPQQNLNETREYCVEEYHIQHTEEESRSKIEAELEAELERLELSMTSTKLVGKYTELVELDDPDFIPDLAEGELRDDVFDRAEPLDYADRDESTDPTPHSANYAVSPRELSLRLYEVINSQLEQRNRELETEVENLQRKARDMEVLTNSWREFSNSEAWSSSSAQGSPLAKDERLTADCVVMNLAGEALDAYNDGYDELSKILESEEDEMALGAAKIQHDHDLYQIHNGRLIDENEDEDEMEKLLIEQIVEKARKGSPAVFSAQKTLFCLDENED